MHLGVVRPSPMCSRIMCGHVHAFVACARRPACTRVASEHLGVHTPGWALCLSLGGRFARMERMAADTMGDHGEKRKNRFLFYFLWDIVIRGRGGEGIARMISMTEGGTTEGIDIHPAIPEDTTTRSVMSEVEQGRPRHKLCLGF